MTLFDWLKEINYKKSPPDQFTTDDWKSFTPFMINRYLSLHPELIVLVNEVQMLNTTNKKVLYNAIDIYYLNKADLQSISKVE